MKNYLSFGGGVNSVAMMLLLLDEGVEFEAVYVDHGCDWPETRDYVAMLRERYPITVIQPEYRRDKKVGEVFNNLYEYCMIRNIIPLRMNRWCTKNFKVDALHRYFETPCFVLLGIDAGESHRARLSSVKGMENRYPLIEMNINRTMCLEIIKVHGLPKPIKSGCWFCPFQRLSQFRQLRRKHPDLWCKVLQMERNSLEYALSKGRTIDNSCLVGKAPLDKLIDDRDAYLFEEMAYPPCNCGL